MSLVYEALQKAAKEKARQSSPPAPVHAPAPPPVTRQQRRWGWWLVGLSLPVVLGVAAWLMLPEKPVPTPRPEPAPPPAVEPTTSSVNPARFQLTGIMKMGESYGAVINGRIVYDGHYVDGAIVSKIERDRVTLTVDGKDVVVRLF